MPVGRVSLRTGHSWRKYIASGEPWKDTRRRSAGGKFEAQWGSLRVGGCLAVAVVV